MERESTAPEERKVAPESSQPGKLHTTRRDNLLRMFQDGSVQFLGDKFPRHFRTGHQSHRVN